MSVTYSGMQSGVTLVSGFSVKNPVTVAATGTITGGAGYDGDAVYGTHYAWTLTNLGTIEAAASAAIGIGIVLRAGGSVVNGASGSTAAVIEDYGGGILMGGAGTVANFGTIAGEGGTVGGAGPGVVLSAGGTVANYGAILGGNVGFGPSGGSPGVTIGADGIVTNSGLIAGGGGKVAGAAGVAFQDTGTVTNLGTITGGGGTYGASGIQIGGAGTVTNLGTVEGGNRAPAVSLGAGGITNGQRGSAGLISGANGIEIAGPGTVTNFGTIVGELQGRAQVGVRISGPGLVANYGTIAGRGTAVALLTNGQVVNPGMISSQAIYQAGAGGVATLASRGIDFYGTGQAFNSGTVVSTAEVHSGSYGTVGTLASFGLVLTLGGTVVNSGVISSEADNSSARVPVHVLTSYGILMDGPGIVTNSGTIEAVVSDTGGSPAKHAVGDGVLLTDGGVFDNSSGGTVTGNHAVVATAPATVTNAGQITGAGTEGIGVYLGTNGVSLTNIGVISGYDGLVTAGDTAGNAIENAGTIAGSGGTAMVLGAYDRLVVDPGAVFVGYVLGSGNDTLELAAGSGGMIGLGSQFQRFAIVRVDYGADWSLAGAAPDLVNDGTVSVYGALSFGKMTHDASDHGVINLGNNGTAEFTAAVAKGERLVFTDDTGTLVLDTPRRFSATISGFQAGDAIDLADVKANGLAFADHELLLTRNGRTVADLHFAGRYRAGEFALSRDGHGGTEITLATPAAAPFWTMPA